MQIWNTFKTTLLLAALTGLFLGAGFLIGGTTGMLFALVVALVMNFGAWWFSDKIALRMSGAREVSPAEMPGLYQLVEHLAQRAGIPAPRMFIIESDTPNAFATGRNPSRGVVAVTTGIMSTLSTEELAGVIAHELAHIRNRDTLIASIAASVAGAVTFLAEMATWAMIFGGFGGSEEGEEGGLGELAGSLLMIVLAPIAALVIQLAVSRAREYNADAEGARILGNPLPLASALERLEESVRNRPMDVNPASSSLYIVNPVFGGLGGLFRTHPDTSARVVRLRAMARPEYATAG